MSEAVVVTARIGKGNMEIIKELTTDAVRLALEQTKADAIAYEQGGASPVPIDTGLLRSSFMISIVSQTIAMKWSAIRPADKNQFDYAGVQDAKHNYSGKMKEWVKRKLHENLISMLKMVFAGGVTL